MPEICQVWQIFVVGVGSVHCSGYPPTMLIFALWTQKRLVVEGNDASKLEPTDS